MVQYTPASDKFVHNVSVDFKRRAVNEQIHVVQYDNSLPIIAVSLFSDYMPYSIPANAEGNIRIKKKDGTYVYNPALGCNSDGTVLYFEVTHQITTFPGVLEPIIEIRIGTMVAASGTIKVEVDKNPIQSGDIESTNEYKTIQGYVEVVKENARNAKLSEDNAKISENNARTSENNAKTSETNSKASETAAANSASSAAGSASAASTSESNAAASADNAEESANMAKMYAQQAKDTDYTTLINQLAGYKVITKMEDSNGDYISDSDGNYIETETRFVNPDDVLSILERVAALEKAVYEK